MAKTEFVYITGKLSWVKCTVPNPWNKWTVTVHPNAESLDKIRDLQAEGVKNVIKKDDDGYNVTFSRPCSREMKGKVIGMTPPEVLHPNGTPLRDTMVGNGSDGVVKLEVYTHKVPGTEKTAKAARLLSVRVDNLVPFMLKRDFDENQQRAVKGLDQQPEQLF